MRIFRNIIHETPGRMRVAGARTLLFENSLPDMALHRLSDQRKEKTMPPNFPLGPEVPLGTMREGSARVSIPVNSVLYRLQFGKARDHFVRWLTVHYRSIEGPRRVDLEDAENLLPTISAPANDGAGEPVSIPPRTLISGLQLTGGP